MDEREVAETMRGLGYLPTFRGGPAWFYPRDSRMIYSRQQQTRWYATYVGAGFIRRTQEFSCPAAAALWLAVEVA